MGVTMGKRTVVSRVAGVADGSTDLVLRIPVGATAGLVCYQSISVCDADSVCTRIDVGFTRGASSATIWSVGSPVAGVTYWMSGSFYLPIDHVLTVRFIGASSGDKCSAVVLGYVADTAGP